jgi:NADH:ubiquinone oxidoreductase subunit F (NADH-binding)
MSLLVAVVVVALPTAPGPGTALGAARTTRRHGCRHNDPGTTEAMTSISRVLDAEPVPSLRAYLDAGGGAGLDAAARLGPAATIDEVAASGLRGRGGAGFPTSRKWQAVATNASPDIPATVVVNAAEGEPGSFKDRALLRRNPFRVLEGALIAAGAVGADRVVVALKATFAPEVARVEQAIAQAREQGWLERVNVGIVAGPSEYLYGEETALLEVVDGRPPFPRIAPPYRHGVDEIGDDAGEGAAELELSAPEDDIEAPPTLVNNTETMANVPGVLAHGADWYREAGTDASPGTIVCTVTGSTRRHGVGEYALGTPLATVIEEVGGGVDDGRSIAAVMSGVANAMLPGRFTSTPLTYEAMVEAGAGLGAAGFIVFDDAVDLVAVAHGVARFLAVESCGQCTPCKQDGLAMAELFDRVRRNEANEIDLVALNDRILTVADSARCTLATQQQVVARSVLQRFPDAVRRHLEGAARPAEPYVVAPIVDIVDGRAVIDTQHARKQPDWTFDDTYSGASPADRIDERAHYRGHA